MRGGEKDARHPVGDDYRLIGETDLKIQFRYEVEVSTSLEPSIIHSACMRGRQFSDLSHPCFTCLLSPTIKRAAGLDESDMDALTEIIKYLLIIVGASFLLAIVLVVVISKLSAHNPLRLMLTALTRRVAATAGIALVDIPATAMQPIGDVWDIGTLIFLAYYWYTFFRDDAGRAIRTLRDVARSTPKSQ